MSDWTFVYDAFNPETERQREALFTLANGYMGTRAAMPWSHADDTHYPGTYLAGIYNRLESEIEGQAVEIESMPNVPNWLPTTWRIEGGRWFDLREMTIHGYREALDLQRGLLTRECDVEDSSGRRTVVRERRFVHMAHCHLAGLELTLEAKNWSGSLELCWGIDGSIENALVSSENELNNRHLHTLETGSDASGTQWLKSRTTQSRVEIDVATRTRVAINGVHVSQPIAEHRAPDRIGQTTHLDISQGDTISIEKIAAFYTSRDPAISEGSHAARRAVTDAPGFDTLLRSHVTAWEVLWGRCDIALQDGDTETQRIVRLHLFQVLQTTSIHTRNLDVGVLARGLSGEAYHGHIFWDELMVIPYLNLHFPGISRAMLRYRFLRLGEARQRAREAGYSGAMFPWQSGSSGREETPPFYPNPRTGGWIADHTPLQRHIGSAIAYNIWHYYAVTRDKEYLATEGAEMLLEIARFWSSIATFNAEHDRYEIHGVMGPDEFHTGYPWSETPGISNNTYTNVMAVRTLRTALEALDQLPEWRNQELRTLLGLDENEISRWRDICKRMRVEFLDGGELAQFEHYDRLEELDWDAYEQKYGDVQRLDFILDAEGDSPNRYRVTKQPDVLMLFHILSREELEHIFHDLGYGFDEETWQRTIEYYTQRSSRGSTLSRVVEAEILAGFDESRSWQCLQQALQSDVGDIQGGSTGEGIHVGAMAGTISIIERRYTGIDARGDVLHFAPALPDELDRLDLRLLYRGSWIDVAVSHRRLQLNTASDVPEPIANAGEGTREDLSRDHPIDWTW